MPCRAGILFVLALDAFCQLGALEIEVDAHGDMDATVMLQTSGSHAQMTGNLKEEVINAESPAKGPPKWNDYKLSAAFAEYVAMTLFVVIGCGSAMGSAKEPGWVLQVALSFGFAITSLAYAIGHYSGGHINCAVTIGLLLAGHVGATQALLNIIAQVFGSITGAFLLTMITPQESDKTGGIGANKVNTAAGYTYVNALFGEAAMTFLLMFVVLETAINPLASSNRALACVAIGFAVFLAHSVMIPIDGCSINPTRSFGPAVIAKFFYKESDDAFKDHWVFWLGPLSGAAGAVLISSLLSA